MTYESVFYNNIEFKMCESCGSLVLDESLHNDWHGHVRGFASKAQYADMMLRPIGPGHQLPDQDYVDKQMEEWFGKIQKKLRDSND